MFSLCKTIPSVLTLTVGDKETFFTLVSFLIVSDFSENLAYTVRAYSIVSFLPTFLLYSAS